jgi:hypothetical protein
MKTMTLFCVLLVMFFSCDSDPLNASPNDLPNDPANPYPAPKNIDVSVFQSQVELSWEAIQKADGYVVSYGNSPTYGAVKETQQSSLSISLNVNNTWYFAVQAKYGGIKSQASDQIVLKGGVVIFGTNEEGKNDPKQDNPEPGPFDYAGFAAQKAAWEARTIKSYRFTGKLSPDYTGYPVYVQSTVYDGKEPEVSVEPADDLEAGNLSQDFKTIDDLYSYIESHRTDTDLKFAVRYNEQYHYPEYYLETMGPGFDGGSFGVEITEFEPLGNN